MSASESRFVTPWKTNDAPSNLFSVRDGILTAIEDIRGDHLIRLASTSEVLWFDERYPGRPLLGYKHGRQFDRSLSIQTVNLTSRYRKSTFCYFLSLMLFCVAPLTLLTSRRNGLVTVYDVSASQNGLLHVNTAPYCLSSAPCHNIEQVLLRRSKDSVSLLRMFERGNVHSMDVNFTAEGDGTIPSGSQHLAVVWSKSIREMQTRSTDICPEVGPRGARDTHQVDFRPTYERMLHHPFFHFVLTQSPGLFGSDDCDVEWGRERDPEVVYEAIERIPLFWQLTDGQAETMLTT